jgi:hypothetical protein
MMIKYLSNLLDSKIPTDDKKKKKKKDQNGDNETIL